MNVTQTSLEALILKATHESLPCPDAAALEAFCAVMKDSAEGSHLAAQALAARIHSTNAREAMLALCMLDRCMRRCDPNFHAEIGKFRFLNEMIKLVSPKYLADRTAPEVRTRVVQLLHAWAIEYPKEAKFKVAYDMLKNQGVVKETPPPLPPEDAAPPSRRAKASIFEDDEKSKLLQKLLQSKKPEDIQHANRIIKTMVREEERRNEASSRRAQELTTALDSAGLLKDMLECADNASPDELQLIHELYTICVRMRPALQQLAASDGQAENLTEILQASDLIDEVYEKYNKYMDSHSGKQKSEPPVTNESLLDFAGAPTEAAEPPKNQTKKNSIDELGDIFSTESNSTNIAEPLKPVSLLPTEDVDLLVSDKSKTEGWNELDSLGEQLLKQSLPSNAKRLDSFNNSKSKKIPMNELASPKNSAKENGPVFDLDFFTQKQEEPKPLPAAVQDSSADDLIVDISEASASPNNNNNILDISIPIDRTKTEHDDNKFRGEVKPLTDINVALESVHPSAIPPLTAFEDDSGVTVVFHICKDKPRPDVNVIVVSTTSRNKSPIEDYKFQAVVPKGYKVRLLPASGAALPARTPFVPPAALTQVMLLARPRGAPPPDLKFVITYSCDDDMYSEIGELTQLPLHDVY